MAHSSFAQSGSGAGAETDTEADEEVLRAAHLSTEGPSLLTVFRKRTPDADLRARVQTLIAQLGSVSFAEREEASDELAACGVAAAGLLRGATRHVDLEIRRRARQALAFIESNDLSEDVLISALRLLGRRKPARMAEVLLDYVPYAASDDVIEELCQALTAAAVRDGEADPVLVRALTDPSPRRRGAAGAALGRAGCRSQRAAVRRLLRDSDANVRRRVALALLEARDKSAVPVLIDLLAQLPLAEAEPIEGMLLQLAGETPPQGALDTAAARRKYRTAWADWWKRRGDDLDLSAIELAPRWRGYTLAIGFAAPRGRGRSGCLLELDAHGRTRWQIQGLSTPVDARVLDERRVLVTEYSSGQVTERNHNGDILRRINVSDSPLEARRLPNGNTLITTRSRVFEVDRNDKEVWTANGARADMIVSACPLRGGAIGICHRTGEFLRLDRTGKVLASFQVGRLFRPTGTHIQGLANGHIVVPLFYDNKIVELDDKGREVWSAAYPRPASAQRLPNGRTLVVGYGSNVIVELDKEGREVKSQRCEGRLLYARGR